MQHREGLLIKHGVAPFFECSTRGDKRFSAFCAYVEGVSIESLYQAAKCFEDGSTGRSWRHAKGLVATNQEELKILYSHLWDRYIAEHPELLTILQGASGLSDMFGQPGHVCQATELWRIREKSLLEDNHNGK